MNAIKQKISKNFAPYHFLVYCLSFLAYGSIISGIGPLVPYLSQITGQQQTQYRIIFLFRSIGFILGALVLRNLQKNFTYHQILLLSSVIITILCSLFCFLLNITYQSAIIFLISFFCCFFQVTINLSVLETQKGGDIQLWMLLCHGFFGIGALLGPYIVFLFQTNSYIVMGLMIFIICPLYCILQTPQKHEQIVKKVSKQNYLDQIRNLGHQSQYPIIYHKDSNPIIGKQIENLICFMCFLYVGLQIGYSSWISSYMVMEGIANKQLATTYNSIFWISFTLFRFVTTFIPLSSFKKLSLFSYCLFFSAIISCLMIFIDLLGLACAFSTVAFGMCLSSLFPLLLAIPAQYNLEVSSTQGANFMIWLALGEGTLSTIMGYLMDWFNNNFLFFTMVVMGFGFLISTHILKIFYEKSMLEQSQSTTINDRQKPEIELIQMLMIKK